MLTDTKAHHVLLCHVVCAGKVVSAAAGPVADAAQQLGWQADAAFELLGEVKEQECVSVCGSLCSLDSSRLHLLSSSATFLVDRNAQQYTRRQRLPPTTSQPLMKSIGARCCHVTQ